MISEISQRKTKYDLKLNNKLNNVKLNNRKAHRYREDWWLPDMGDRGQKKWVKVKKMQYKLPVTK